jgi:hypothetical protein
VSALGAALRTRSGALNAAALGPLMRDPFWADRYPGRAGRMASEDGAYHLTYLAEALEAADARVMTRYARWLRDVLVARGMCSLHLAWHFRRLAEEVAAAGLPGGAEAVRFLSAAERALAHEAGPAAELAAALPRIAARLRAEAAPALAGLAPGGDTGDLESLLAYLADAVAVGRPELFARCCQHLGPFLVRRGCAPGGLGAALGAAARAVEAEALSPDAAAAALHVLAEGRLALAAAGPAQAGGPEPGGGASRQAGSATGPAEPDEGP